MNVMAESPVYQKMLEQGEAKGRAEGRAEGEVKGLRKAIDLALEIRFGAAAKKVWPVLASCSDLARLRRTAEAVKTVPSLGQFQRLFGKAGNGAQNSPTVSTH